MLLAKNNAIITCNKPTPANGRQKKEAVFLNALTIRQKLNLIFAVLILVFVAVSIYSTYALNKINEGAMRIATTHLLSVLVATDNGKGNSNIPLSPRQIWSAAPTPRKKPPSSPTKSTSLLTRSKKVCRAESIKILTPCVKSGRLTENISTISLHFPITINRLKPRRFSKAP